jgi:hypothetical protein
MGLGRRAAGVLGGTVTPKDEPTIAQAARDFVKDAGASARYAAAVERDVAAALRAVADKIARAVKERKP